MTLDELANLFATFTNEHYAKKDLQGFFQLFHRLALKGMGLGIGGSVESSGEILAMRQVKQTLESKYPRQNLTVFDVGANVGGFLTAALSVFSPANSRFLCFEPSPRAYAQLQKLIASQAGAKATAFNFGFGDQDQTVPLFADAAGSGWASVYQRRLDHVGVQIHHVEEATLTTIDTFAAAQAIERIHFLKLDVEGHEFKCLQGAKSMIEAGQIDFIQFAFDGTDIDSRTFFQDFWYGLKNYRISRMLRDGFYTIDKYSELEEIFMPQNFLAELK